MSSLKVVSSQNVTIEFKLASLGMRIGAFLIDAFIIGISVFIIFLIFRTDGSSEGYIFFVMISLIPLLYHLVCEITMKGTSPGKKALNLRVITEDGKVPGLTHYFLRWILRFVDVMFSSGSVAITSISLTDKYQRVGDIAAGTVVIDTYKTEMAASEAARAPFRSENDDSAEPVFAQAAELSEADYQQISSWYVQLFKDKNKVDESVYLKLSRKLKLAVLKKTGIKDEQLVAMGLSDMAFVAQVLKDYIRIKAQQSGSEAEAGEGDW
ncbi:MAG: RDD family protein [Balneolales bacterium]|nr:RDD family protein [Balneolales bacterium]